MPIWPFKRRKKSSVAVDKRPAADNDNLHSLAPRSHPLSRISSRKSRACSQRSKDKHNHDHELMFSPPNARESSEPANEPDAHEYQQQNCFSSYITEQNELSVMSARSSASCRRPHKRISLIRKFSISTNEDQTFWPPVAYLSRRSSKKHQRSRCPAATEFNRPPSRTSMESHVPSRAYKIRRLDVFSPHPTLHYDELLSQTSSGFGNPKLAASPSNSPQSNSQTGRYQGPRIREDERHARVEDLVSELDARGLREAMEREQRWRERKKVEYEERLRVKLMKASRRDAFKADPSHDNSEDKQYRRDYPVPGSAGFRNDTPLSWFNTDPSVEDLSKEISQFPSKPEVSTFPESRPQETFVEMPSVATGASDSPAVREKTSSWASFIQRATAPRMRKEQRLHGAPVTSPALASPPGGESEHCAITQDNNISDAFLDVDHLRHREGQTPGRHISNEIALAMAAVATGRIQDQSFRGHEFSDELRGSILSPEAYDFQNVSQLSLKSCSAAHGFGLRGGASASKSYSPTTFPDRKDSPTIAPHNTRPPSAQRYSPTFHRLSSGAASPDNKPRSQMSTSLASIDSEGSWLSGKIVTRQSVHQLSPLRTSDDDDYFTGLDHHSKDVGGGSDGCGARSDLDDMAEDKSAASEDECNMWREGPGKRIQLEGPTRAIYRPGILNSFDEPRPFQFPQHDTATIPNQISPEFGTPLQLSVQLTESYHAR